MNIKSLLICFLIFSSKAWGQNEINWQFVYNTDTKSLEMKADLQTGWHIYSQNIADGIGPIPTLFTFEKNSNVQLIGKTSEPQAIEKYDATFEAYLKYFEKNVVFNQKIKLKKNTILKGRVTYMLCSDSQCLPPVDLDFSIQIQK